MSQPSPSARRELLRRAAHYLTRDWLEVDYYRIRQKLFFPLPPERLPEAASTVRGFTDYPFKTWYLWALEERLLALGHTAELGRAPKEQAAAHRDLLATASLRNPYTPNLQTGHLARILTTALQWRWPTPTLRKRVQAGLWQLVEDGWPLKRDTPAGSLEALLEQGFRLPNIPTIGALGLSQAATACGHPLAGEIEAHAQLLAELWLGWGLRGHVEGVSYDGYTADFIVDWAATRAPALRRRFLAHPRLVQIVEEAQLLGAPGCPENVAAIGDVEPYEMPFQHSFVAKYLRLRKRKPPLPTSLARLRTDALPHLPASPGTLPKKAAPLQDAHYALVLQARGVKAALSWSHSAMGHMQPDMGSLVIGAAGEWLLSDPGYRQYLPTAEQAFTLAPSAHNQPVINGAAATQRPAQRPYARKTTPAGAGVRLALGPCYPGWKGSLRREVLQDRAGRLLVSDHFRGEPIHQVDYHWHGHPAAFWQVAGGNATLLVGRTALTLTCLEAPLEPCELQRLRGSRGQLSLVKTLRYPTPRKSLTLRWLFEVTDGVPPLSPKDLASFRPLSEAEGWATT